MLVIVVLCYMTSGSLFTLGLLPGGQWFDIALSVFCALVATILLDARLKQPRPW